MTVKIPQHKLEQVIIKFIGPVTEDSTTGYTELFYRDKNNDVVFLYNEFSDVLYISTDVVTNIVNALSIPYKELRSSLLTPAKILTGKNSDFLFLF